MKESYSEGVASHLSPHPCEGGTLERQPIVFDFRVRYWVNGCSGGTR
jgi:hypothetical protein